MLHRAYVELHRHAGFVSFMGKLGGVGEPGGLKRQGKGQAFTGQMGLICPISRIHSFRRICNPPVLIIRICNPIDNSLLLTTRDEGLSGLQILIMREFGIMNNPSNNGTTTCFRSEQLPTDYMKFDDCRCTLHRTHFYNLFNGLQITPKHRNHGTRCNI